MNIRTADLSDFPRIFELIKEFSNFQKTPEKVKITLEEMVENASFIQALALENDSGEIVGFASYFPSYHSWTGKAIYVDDLYIQPDYRQGGWGKSMLQLIIEKAKSDNCSKVRWLVSSWNIPAINFYQALGAQLEEVDIVCDLNLD